jgi:hypothetical protein
MSKDKGMDLIQQGIKYMEHWHARTLTREITSKTLEVVEEIRLYDPILAKDIIASLPDE